MGECLCVCVFIHVPMLVWRKTIIESILVKTLNNQSSQFEMVVEGQGSC